ncbi:MAG: hypothetical protein ACI4CS_06170 [Candidatus Weimeria sp.]
MLNLKRTIAVAMMGITLVGASAPTTVSALADTTVATGSSITAKTTTVKPKIKYKTEAELIKLAKTKRADGSDGGWNGFCKLKIAKYNDGTITTSKGYTILVEDYATTYYFNKKGKIVDVNYGDDAEPAAKILKKGKTVVKYLEITGYKGATDEHNKPIKLKKGYCLGSGSVAVFKEK